MTLVQQPQIKAAVIPNVASGGVVTIQPATNEGWITVEYASTRWVVETNTGSIPYIELSMFNGTDSVIVFQPGDPRGVYGVLAWMRSSKISINSSVYLRIKNLHASLSADLGYIAMKTQE